MFEVMISVELKEIIFLRQSDHKKIWFFSCSHMRAARTCLLVLIKYQHKRLRGSSATNAWGDARGRLPLNARFPSNQELVTKRAFGTHSFTSPPQVQLHFAPRFSVLLVHVWLFQLPRHPSGLGSCSRVYQPMFWLAVFFSYIFPIPNFYRSTRHFFSLGIAGVRVR